MNTVLILNNKKIIGSKLSSSEVINNCFLDQDVQNRKQKSDKERDSTSTRRKGLKSSSSLFDK